MFLTGHTRHTGQTGQESRIARKKQVVYVLHVVYVLILSQSKSPKDNVVVVVPFCTVSLCAFILNAYSKVIFYLYQSLAKP